MGLVVIGHFSLDGQLKNEHYAERHHNMFVAENRCNLMHQIIDLLSFTGQTIVEIVTEPRFSGKVV